MNQDNGALLLWSTITCALLTLILLFVFQREKDFDARWAKVSEEISEEGHYELTEDELIFGARTAWRNAPRCSGRSQWKNLVIRDCRYK